MKKLISFITAAAYLSGLFSGLGLISYAAAEDYPVPVEVYDSDFIDAGGESDFIETSAQTYTSMFRLPDNMRAAVISPETDFLFSEDDDKYTVSSQLDDIYTTMTEIGLNAVIIRTSVEDRHYYDLDMNRNGKTDFIQLAVEKAQAFFLGVYLVFDISHAVNPVNDTDSAAINTLISETHRFTLKYPCDGIILDNYYNDTSVNDFARYMRTGAGIGYENWLYDSTEYLFETAGGVVRLTDNTVPVGVMINDMWANSSSLSSGSPTSDTVQAYFDGYADTKKYLEQNYADFIMLRCYGSLTSEILPFTEAAQWWGELCGNANIPMYLIHHNEKLGSAGWAEDQLLKQLVAAKNYIATYNGSIFNSYASLKTNTMNSAVKLREYYDEQIDEAALDSELTMHSPKSFSFSTYERYVDFMGAFDRNFDVYFNGRRIELNEAGNFWFEEELKIGVNVFTIEHKGKVYSYRIQHNIITLREIDKSIGEGKSLKIDGGTSITLEAVAYRGAKVTATVNGQTVTLREQDTTLQDEDAGSSYTLFRGRYKTPGGIIGREQALGQISITATYAGQSRTMLGANVYVNAEPEPPPKVEAVLYDESSLGSGEVVGTISAVRGRGEDVTYVKLYNNYTHVFDAKTTGTVFDPNLGQLPAGTVDYYRADSGGFYTTESGKRFLGEDAALVAGKGIGVNALNVVRNGTLNGNSYFEINLGTRISYNVQVAGLTYFTEWGSDYNIKNFSAEYIYITFDNITSVTKLPAFENNYVFSAGRWEQVTIGGVAKFRLVLKLRQTGVYAGNGAYYNNAGNLMLYFPVTTNTLSGKTIVIDPGHGYGASADKFDPGAIGEIREVDATLAVAKLAEEKFTALGANVIRLKTTESFLLTKNRPVIARSYDCDLFISLHCNAVAGNSSARGTEVYYYTPFSQPLAQSISNSISGYFTNSVYKDGADKNRGAKNSYFWVTVQQDFPSVLVEMGFVTNLEDAMALGNSKHQNGIADAIVKGVQNYFSRSSLTSYSSGTSEIPEHLSPESQPPEETQAEREPEVIEFDDTDDGFDDDLEEEIE